MRNFLFAVLALLTFGTLCAQQDTDKPGHVIIIKPLDPPDSSNTPRPLSLIADIEAGYYNGALTVVFNADLGNADIVVSNLTTGDTWSDSVTGVGSATLLLSGDEGYYEIAIYTDGGDYSGEFTL